VLDEQLMKNAAVDSRCAARNQRERAGRHSMQRDTRAVGVDDHAPPGVHITVIENNTNSAVGIVHLQFRVN
jgi:hypothetical protein